ncbi:MAG TPA: NAD(P)-dependent oxidoreductase [Burkholderiales bacterium]|nr:NAD(P)-dependent oxidoreductase [Burkholderiales bacterium]
MNAKIGFVGIGAMGWPMAANLVKAGFAVQVADARAGQAAKFAAEAGAKVAPSLRALGEASDVVITMLPTSKEVRAVLLEGDGVAAGLRAGAVVIDMSSGVPGETAAIAERLAATQVAMLDAPVSGGVRKAVTGELAIMVGGDAKVAQQAEPVLRAMGKSVIRAGGIGSGQAMKALNNLVSAGGFLIGIEALLVGKKFGLDPAVMVDILNASTGMNNSTQVKFKQFVLSGAFNAGFSLDLMVKDVGIALDVAKDLEVNAPFSALCRNIWSAAQADLGAGRDHTELAKYAAKVAGVNLG